MTIGHEFVGHIVEMGSNVQDFKIGDRVSAEGHVVCGHCRNCLAGRRHLCNSPSGIGVNRDGAFAEYISVPVTNTWYCDPSISSDVISCFDPLGNAVHTALSFNLVGEDILITGAGPIGCMAVAVAKQVGARHIVITDINPDRLELARSSVSSLDTLSIWWEKLSDNQAQLHILAEAERSEEITDRLRTALADSGEELRIVSLPVEASIPAPEETPEQDRKPGRILHRKRRLISIGIRKCQLIANY